MNDFDKTITFSIHEDDREAQRKALLRNVYDALSEKGYSAIEQMVEYLLTEEPTYITNHKNARSLICKVDRDDILNTLVRNCLDI